MKVYTFNRPRNELFEETDVALTIGASPNMSPTNNRVVVTCFASPQDHCVSRGFMEECAPTLNAAAGTSGNNRPFIVRGRNKNVIPINSMVIGKDGGNGDRQTFGIGAVGDPCPTLQTAHHHAVAIVENSIAVLDRCGNNWKNGKGGCGPLLHNEYAPTLATMFQPFVIKGGRTNG